MIKRSLGHSISREQGFFGRALRKTGDRGGEGGLEEKGNERQPSVLDEQSTLRTERTVSQTCFSRRQLDFSWFFSFSENTSRKQNVRTQKKLLGWQGKCSRRKITSDGDGRCWHQVSHYHNYSKQSEMWGSPMPGSFQRSMNEIRIPGGTFKMTSQFIKTNTRGKTMLYWLYDWDVTQPSCCSAMLLWLRWHPKEGGRTQHHECAFSRCFGLPGPSLQHS